MRILLKILGLLFIISCQQNTSNLRKDEALTSQSIKADFNEDIVANNQIRRCEYKWVQYKRIPVINSNDTIPIENNYLLIEADIVTIYINDDIIEKHNLIRDYNYSFPSYYFEDKPDDVLQFLDKDKLVIKRDDFDGLQEYYIKKRTW